MFFICPFYATAQSTYLQQGDKAYQLLERLEIKSRTNADFNFSNLKYFSRKMMVQAAEAADSINKVTVDTKQFSKLTAIDEYNLQSFYMGNSEWYSGSKDAFTSKKPVLKTFCQTQYAGGKYQRLFFGC